MTALTAILCYTAAWVLLQLSLRKKEPSGKLFIVLVGIGTSFHLISCYSLVFDAQGVYLGLGFFQVATVFFVVMNIIVLLSGIRLPLRNLFIPLLPLSIITLLVAILIQPQTAAAHQLNSFMVIHILLSIVSYSLLAIATLQALLLAYQSRQLKSHHVRSVIGVFPPLQTMETLLFDLVWAGFILLTLSIATGIIFIDDLFEQQLSHKLVFSLLSWAIYSVLLGGRHFVGWRGKTAINWVLAGFIMLILAYFGSKFVLEFLL